MKKTLVTKEMAPIIINTSIRLYRMEILPKKALDMSRSSHLIIGYLIRDEYGGLGV